MFFFRKKEKKTPQNPTKHNFANILDPESPACIFASRISKRSTKTFSSRLPNLTGTAGNSSFRSELHSCQALSLLCHPTATLQSKVMVQEEYKTAGQSQILPN